MEKLKQYVDEGLVEIAKLDDQNKPQKIPYSQLEGQVERRQKNACLYKSIQSLNWDEKYEWVNLKRLKAKQKYLQGLYDESLQIYLQSLVGIDLNDKSENRLQQMRDDLQYPIVLNIATCLYKKKQYQKALIMCDKILVENPLYLPAIYKKAFLLMTCGQLTQAKKLSNLGIKTAKETGQQQQLKNFIQLHGQFIKSEKENKNIYTKMFNQNKNGKQNSTDQEQPLTGDPEMGKPNDQEVLFHDQDNICGKLKRIYKRILRMISPSLASTGNKKKNFHHSNSI